MCCCVVRSRELHCHLRTGLLLCANKRRSKPDFVSGRRTDTDTNTKKNWRRLPCRCSLGEVSTQFRPLARAADQGLQLVTDMIPRLSSKRYKQFDDGGNIVKMGRLCADSRSRDGLCERRRAKAGLSYRAFRGSGRFGPNGL